MRDKQGRFIKGHHYSPATEFKPGQHWRPDKPYRHYDWLYREYVTNGRSSADIAQEWGCTDGAILYWLGKHNIPRRDTSETRKVKHWGAKGKDNPMFGRHGPDHPNWKGGITPDRQAFYSSKEWSWAIKRVWGRDKSRCQRCGKKRRWNKPTFHIHHRITFAIEGIRANIDNLVLLCPKCHWWVHSAANTSKDFLGAFQMALEEVMPSGDG